MPLILGHDRVHEAHTCWCSCSGLLRNSSTRSDGLEISKTPIENDARASASSAPPSYMPVRCPGTVWFGARAGGRTHGRRRARLGARLAWTVSSGFKRDYASFGAGGRSLCSWSMLHARAPGEGDRRPCRGDTRRRGARLALGEWRSAMCPGDRRIGQGGKRDCSSRQIMAQIK